MLVESLFINGDTLTVNDGKILASLAALRARWVDYCSPAPRVALPESGNPGLISETRFGVFRQDALYKGQGCERVTISGFVNR